MIKKRKICVCITARPTYSRVKSVLEGIKNKPELELQLVVAGSALLDRYGTASQYIESDGFKIDEKVFMVLEGENPTSMAKTTAIGLLELSTAFYNLKPDAVVVVADRFETIAVSIAAAYQNIPLVHIQGGEITGNIDEKVRHANTKLADIHFVSNEFARERLIRMGEDPLFVFNTGCPSIDIAAKVLDDPALNFNPVEKYGGVGKIVNPEKGYLVVMQHPVTTEYESSKEHILLTLEAVHELGLPTYWFWPNVDAGADGTSKGIRAFREAKQPDNIHFFKNMDPIDFLKLLFNSKCLVGNSSVGIRECSYLGVPVVNIGSRQLGRERANNVIDVDYTKSEIKMAIKKAYIESKRTQSNLYGEGNSGKEIADLLAHIKLRFHKTISY